LSGQTGNVTPVSSSETVRRLVLVAYALVFGYLAKRFFRLE